MLKFNNHKAEKFVRDKIQSQYKKIKVKSGEISWTYKCHLNSVHHALKRKDKEVALVVAYSKEGHGVVHFINLSKGKYIDNTWGEWSKEYDYYLIEKIHKKDFPRIGSILGEQQNSLRNSLPFWLKLTSNTQW